MLSTLPRTFAFRALAVFMAMVLAFPAFAAGAPAAATDITRLVAMLRHERPPQFSHAPVVRHDNINPKRDKNRSKWWTNQAKAAYAHLPTESNNDQYLMLSISAIPMASSVLVPAWGSGSNAGYPIPGEGSFDAGGSGVTSPQGISGTLNTATGNTTYSLPITSFPVEGDLEVSLTFYHNTQSTYDGPLGAKWTHSYDSFIDGADGYTFVQMPDGLVVVYKGDILGNDYDRLAGWYADLSDDGKDITMTFKDQSKYIYSPGAGSRFLLSQIQDRHGNVIVINHDGYDQVTTVEAEDGRTIEFSYSGGYVDTITGPDSQVWTVSVSSDQLAYVGYPTVGIIDTGRGFAYDGNNDLIEEDDPEGNNWYWEHSGSDELTGWWCDVDGSYHGSVDYYGGATTITPPGYALPYVHTYSSDLLYSIEDPDFYAEYFLNYDTSVRRPMEHQDKRGNSEYFVYDANANITEYTNRRGKVWDYQYSVENDLEEVTTPVVYDPPGPPTPYPQSTTYTWTSGNLESVTNGEGETTEFDYDGDGQLTNARDGEGRETIYTYDPDTGDILTVTPPNGATRTMTYDNYGRVLTSSDSIPNTTTYDYDEWGRMKRVTHPDTSYAEFTYNLCSQKLAATNEIFNTTQFRYDAAGRLEETENPLGDIITKTYDEAWRVSQVENGRGYSTHYGYTCRGDRYLSSMDDGYDDTTSFDGNGNVTEFEVSGTRDINYDYNEEDQLTLVNYTSGTDTTFDYDDGGRQIEMVDSIGTTTWDYDLADRVIALATPQGNMSYQYNDAGQRTKLTENSVGDTDYTYDATTGDLEQVSNRFGEDTVYAYDGLGRAQRKTFDSGQYELYGYDSRYRVTDIDLKNSSNTVLKAQDYVFDDASRVTGYTTGGVATTYGYDDADQLTSESRTGYSAAYTYDENGNRLTRAISGGVSETYAYDDGDKLTGVTWSGGYKDFNYDAEGRMTEYDNNGSTRYFAYDDESQITAISGAYTASYTYNGLDTRMAKTENSVSNTFKRDGAGVTAQVLNDGSAAYTSGISERRSSTTTYMHSGLKNAEAQTGTGETITSERTYDAFGNVLNTATGPWSGPFGYAGSFGYQEDATGLRLLGHRYYDPSLGRFLTRDPAQDGRNWYSYCENNPVSYADAYGLARLIIIGNCDGVPGGRDGGYVWAYSPFHPDDIDLSDYGRAELIWYLINVADPDDEIVLYGHGSSGGTFSLKNGEYLSPDDVRYIASERARRRKGKLKRAWVGSCHSMATKNAIDAWLGLVDTVGGYTGFSASEHGGISSPAWFDRSPRSDPNPQANPKAGPKNRKGGKRSSKW